MENSYKLATTSWRDDYFIQTNGLNINTALDYFCQISNPFYEKHSANEISKMNHRRIDTAKLYHQGMHYDININQSRDPDLFIINQKHGKNKILKIFYIIGGTVYQSPSLYDTISSRLNNSLNLLNQTFKEIKEEYSTENGKYYLKNYDEVKENDNDDSIPMQYDFDENLNKLLINLQNETKNEIENKKVL
eukprot:gene3459-6108_t